jgi:hypothetical protein
MCACDPISIILIEIIHLFLSSAIFYYYSRDELLCSFVSIFQFRLLFVKIQNNPFLFFLFVDIHIDQVFCCRHLLLSLLSCSFRTSCAFYFFFENSRLTVSYIQCANVFVFLLICFFNVFFVFLLFILDVSLDFNSFQLVWYFSSKF